MGALTDAAIRAAKPHTTVWDSTLKGFGVRAGRDRKTFVVLIGSGRRQAIGPYGPSGFTLSEARIEARRIFAEKILGRVRPKHVAFGEQQESDEPMEWGRQRRCCSIHRGQPRTPRMIT